MDIAPCPFRDKPMGAMVEGVLGAGSWQGAMEVFFSGWGMSYWAQAFQLVDGIGPLAGTNDFAHQMTVAIIGPE